MPPRRRTGSRGASNPGRSREHNRRVVLELDARSMAASAAASWRDMTHLTPQAVTNIIDDLIAEDLILPRGGRRRGAAGSRRCSTRSTPTARSPSASSWR